MHVSMHACMHVSLSDCMYASQLRHTFPAPHFPHIHDACACYCINQSSGVQEKRAVKNGKKQVIKLKKKSDKMKD
jgi:hypothetical protein